MYKQNYNPVLYHILYILKSMHYSSNESHCLRRRVDKKAQSLHWPGIEGLNVSRGR